MEAQGRINGGCHTNEGAPKPHTTVNSFLLQFPSSVTLGGAVALALVVVGVIRVINDINWNF